MDDIYRAEIIDHYKHPRNFGPPPLKLREGDRIVVAKEANASCGDMIEMGMRLKIENCKLKIDEIKFRGIGCAISTAAGSLLTEAVLGKTVEEVKQLTDKDVVGLLGIEVSPTRMKCALLPLRALQKAVKGL